MSEICEAWETKYMKRANMKASVSMQLIADTAYMKNCVRLVIRLYINKNYIWEKIEKMNIKLLLFLWCY